ncbi:MAG TPA: GGDEF domain-containing protein [Solirubrobacterales bacterium]
MDSSPAGQILPSQAQREQLAKDWLLRMIDRTPLAAVGELPIPWLTAEAPPLIDSILENLAAPEPTTELPEADRARAGRLARMRKGPSAPEQIPLDLAALQGLLVQELRRELPEREPGDYARAVERLANVFGSIQGAVATQLVAEGSAGAGDDPVTGLHGPAQLDEWLGILLAEQRRYGHGFGLALVDVDGLGRINDAYGHDAGDRMLVAVAGIVRRQLRDVDRAFRLEEDEFAIVATHTDAAGLVPLATRIANLISRSQSPDGPRIAIAAGVVDCPGDGLSAERLLESAAEATYAAKASGAAVARSPNGSDAVLQDP